MTRGAGHALEQALAYYRTPALLSAASKRPLPDDVLDLIRVAAGDEVQLAKCSAASGESSKLVQEAAVFFVQQVMFAPGASQHRVLGVNPGAALERMREHYRWLVRWLHPDRNDDDWDNVYADRVVRAWQALRRLDATAVATQTAATAQDDAGDWPIEEAARPDAGARVSGRMAVSGLLASEEALLSPGTARRLPAFVLGGLALIAVSAVGLLWALQQPQRPLPPPTSPPTVGGTSVPTLPPETPDPAPLSPTLVGGTSVPTATIGTEVPPTVAAIGTEGPTTAAAIGTEVPPTKAVGMPRPVVRVAEVIGTEVPPTAEAIGTEVPPTAEVVGAEGAPAVAPTLQEARARELLGEFSAAYAAGDINALMQLFTRDATNNRGGRDAIVYDYQSLFSDSRRRELQLVPHGWIERGDTAVLLAHYEARVTEGLLRGTHATRGEIRFSLREEDGQLKISQVIHE